MGKITHPSKPVNRYVRKKDAIGRVYVLDKKTGKHASNELWKRERQSHSVSSKKTRQRLSKKEKREAELRSERAQRGVETRRRNRETKLRSERAQRGVETRRRNRELAEAKREARRERARRGWETRRSQVQTRQEHGDILSIRDVYESPILDIASQVTYGGELVGKIGKDELGRVFGEIIHGGEPVSDVTRDVFGRVFGKTGGGQILRLFAIVHTLSLTATFRWTLWYTDENIYQDFEDIGQEYIKGRANYIIIDVWPEPIKGFRS
jgi:hypothetical protein